MPDIVFRVYKPDPAKCCEACAFGRGEHAEWCGYGAEQRIAALLLRLAAINKKYHSIDDVDMDYC